MWLKRFTSGLLILGFLLLLAWPTVVAPRKPMDKLSRTEALSYSRRFTVYLAALTLTMVGAGVGAILIMRQAKEEYRAEAKENMRRLIESMKEDADRKDG